MPSTVAQAVAVTRLRLPLFTVLADPVCLVAAAAVKVGLQPQSVFSFSRLLAAHPIRSLAARAGRLVPAWLAPQPQELLGRLATQRLPVRAVAVEAPALRLESMAQRAAQEVPWVVAAAVVVLELPQPALAARAELVDVAKCASRAGEPC